MKDQVRWLYPDIDEANPIRCSVSFSAPPAWMEFMLEDAALYRSVCGDNFRQQRALVVTDAVLSVLSAFDLPDCSLRTLDRHVALGGGSRFEYCHALFRSLGERLPNEGRVVRFPARFSELHVELLFPRHVWKCTVDPWLRESASRDLGSVAMPLLQHVGEFFGQSPVVAARLRAAARGRQQTCVAFISECLSDHVFKDLGVVPVPGIEFSFVPPDYDVGFLPHSQSVKSGASVAG